MAERERRLIGGLAETMEKVLKDANKVLVSGKGAGQVLPHLKLPSINESVKQGTKDAL